MALQITDQSYIGKFASAYWTPALFEMDTIKKRLVNVIDNIKEPNFNIGNIDFTGGLQPREAQPTTQNGTWTVNKKMLTPNDAMFYTEFNPRDLEAHWESQNLSKELLKRKLSPTFESYAMYMMAGRVFESMEVAWWQGSKAYSTITDTTDYRYNLQFFDGFINKMVNDSSVLALPSMTTFDETTILGYLDGLIGLIADNQKGLISKTSTTTRMKFIMSVKSWFYYCKALTTGPIFKGIQYSQHDTPPWKGWEVVVVNGMPDDTILFCEAVPSFDGALHIGMNSTADYNSIQIAKTRPMDETYFVKMLTKMDIQYKYGNEIALATLLTPTDFQP